MEIEEGPGDTFYTSCRRGRYRVPCSGCHAPHFYCDDHRSIRSDGSETCHNQAPRNSSDASEYVPQISTAGSTRRQKRVY